ncbi:MAG: tetratricopeptide repeat protein [Dongiaceae bacterium]
MVRKGKSGESWTPPRPYAASGPLQQAATLLRAGRVREALDACAIGLKRDPRNHRGHATHGLALMQAGRHDEAVAAFARAGELAPANSEYRMNEGAALLNAGRAAEATDRFRQVLAREPRHAVALTNLGYALALQKDFAAALDTLRRAIEIDPDRVEAHFNLGNAMRETGDRSGALRSFRRALELRPDMLAASINLAGMLLDSDAPAARDVFADALMRHPDRPDLRFGLAIALERIGDNDAAIAAYRDFLRRFPDRLEAMNNLAGLLEARGADDEAIALYERALAIDAQRPEMAINLIALYLRRQRRADALRLLGPTIERAAGRADLLLRLGDDARACHAAQAALDCYRQVLERDPENLDAHRRIGFMLLHRDQLDTAREHLEFALASGGDRDDVLTALAEIEQKRRRPAEYEALALRAIAAAPETLSPRSSYLFALNYAADLSAKEIAALHREQMASWLATQSPPRTIAAQPRAGRRLRIGYVSPDFRQHSCAHFFEPLLAAHDASAVEIWCYSAVPRPDDVTDRLRRLVAERGDHWVDIVALDDATAADLVGDDRIDVLVDLAGHTANGRLGMFARRAAPVQMSWLGYPNMTGLPTMDYRLTDELADPLGAGAEALANEELIRIEGGFLAYRPSPAMPAIASGPAARGEPPRFGCFNNAFKLTAPTFALWRALLDQVPDSRLVLRASALRDADSLSALRRDLAAAGCDAERVEFPAYAPTLVEGLAGYADIDVALDPTPYNGTTTTCDALWMGVPVVTLTGDRHAARVGASLLHHAGLPELIAETPARYVEIAAALATDRPRLAALRQSLRPQVASSPLGDARRLAAAFERAFARAVDARLGEAGGRVGLTV